MVQDDEPVGLDGLRVEFDDERVVSDAGVMLVATLAKRLGIEALAQDRVRLRRGRPGAANAGRKLMAVLYAMVLGADSIDDAGVLRAGRTRRLLGGWLPAPSTLGTFLRAFTFGHVRQLDALLGQSIERAWKAGAGPGDGRAGRSTSTASSARSAAISSRAPPTGTPSCWATTRSWPPAPTRARRCTSASGGGRRTRRRGSCASARS